MTFKTMIASLNGFSAPSQGTVLLNDNGVEVGTFDREWSECLIVWKPGQWRKETLTRALSWDGLLSYLVTCQ